MLSRFTRSPHLFSPAMVSVELTFTNLGTKELKDIRVSQKVSFLTPLFHYCIQDILSIVCGFFISWVNVLLHHKSVVS